MKQVSPALGHCGVGFVEGVRCMIWVDDSGISAGAATESTGFVSTSILEMCMRQKLPSST